MKNVEDDVNLSKDNYYDSIIMDSDNMHDFLERSDDMEKVQLYQYVLRKAKILSDEDKEKNQDLISFCWLASMELEHTEAVRRYLNKEITQEDIDEYERQKEAEVQQIVELIEQRRRNKNSMIKQFAGMFKRNR